MYSTYSAHLHGKSHGLSPVCATAGGSALMGAGGCCPASIQGLPKPGEEGIPNTVKSGGLEKAKGNIYLVLLPCPYSERLFEDWKRGLVWFQTALVLGNVL